MGKCGSLKRLSQFSAGGIMVLVSDERRRFLATLALVFPGSLAGFTICLAIVLSLAFLAAPAAMAQANSVLATNPVPDQSKIDDTRYRIGPGDVLTILVRKAPELSLESVRVDQRGMIRIPMIEGEITAACRTENELEKEIAILYLEYKKNPSVNVFVREFQSRPVSVIGAVNQPGQFRLQRQVRLLELLSFAGGPSANAGRLINIIHAGGPNVCEKAPVETALVAGKDLTVLRLNDTLKGVTGSNPFVDPGDIVSLPEADQIFVVGYVVAPRAIPLKDKAITVSRAIAMAGGPQRDSKTSRIHIVRQTSDGEKKQDFIVDLKAIERNQAEDIMLIPNDIVEVPSSTGKMLFNALTGAIAPALTQLPLRTIP
jgi:polysaccharide biosynthesis/export protein